MRLLLVMVCCLAIAYGKESCVLKTYSGEVSCTNITADAIPMQHVFQLDEFEEGITINLRRLEFKNCKIRSISGNTFKLVPQVSQLILKNISLEEIEIKAFQGITRLKLLDLSNNKLTTLHQDLFQTVRLLHLRLDGNPTLEKPTNGPFIKAPWLQSLSLRHCDITHLPGSAFLETPQLQSLDLSRNRLEQLPVDIFQNLSLTHIDLSHNLFKTINALVLQQIKGYPNLPYVVLLSGNRWHCVCDLVTTIAWATEDIKTHYPTTNWSRNRLQTETVCSSPIERNGVSLARYKEWECMQKN